MSVTDIKDIDHIGDGVYVGNDGYQLWLRANNHRFSEFSETPDVALEPAVLRRLIVYAVTHGFLKDKE